MESAKSNGGVNIMFKKLLERWAAELVHSYQSKLNISDRIIDTATYHRRLIPLTRVVYQIIYVDNKDIIPTEERECSLIDYGEIIIRKPHIVFNYATFSWMAQIIVEFRGDINPKLVRSAWWITGMYVILKLRQLFTFHAGR